MKSACLRGGSQRGHLSVSGLQRAGRPLGTQHGQSSRLNSEPPGLSLFLPQDLKKYGATTVVRVCEVTYDKTPLEKDGITVVVRDM